MLKKIFSAFSAAAQVAGYNNIADITKLHSKNHPSQLPISDSSLLLSCCRLQKLLTELYNPAHLPYVPFKLFSIMDCWKQSHLRCTTFFHGQEEKGNNKGLTYFPSTTSYRLLQRRYQTVSWHLSLFVPLLKEQLTKEHQRTWHICYAEPDVQDHIQHMSINTYFSVRTQSVVLHDFTEPQQLYPFYGQLHHVLQVAIISFMFHTDCHFIATHRVFWRSLNLPPVHRWSLFL